MESTTPQTASALVTGELTKLPADVQALVAPAAPLPEGVRFFEERKTYGGIFKSLLIGVALIAVGIALVFPGVLVAIYAAIVGLVFILGGVMMLSSMRSQIRAMQAQHGGDRTRYGVFVTPAAVLVRSDVDYVLIPRAAYHDLQGSTLYYRIGDATKSLNLPALLVGETPASLQQAVRAWAKGAPPTA